MWEIPGECWDAESQICAGLGNAGGQAFDFLTGSDPTVIPLNLGFLSLFFLFGRESGYPPQESLCRRQAEEH